MIYNFRIRSILINYTNLSYQFILIFEYLKLNNSFVIHLINSTPYLLFKIKNVYQIMILIL